MARPLVPTFGWAIVDENGAATQEFQNWMDEISERSEPLVGSGNPEGNLASVQGRFYVDTAAAAGTGIYYKETGNGDTGWVQRS